MCIHTVIQILLLQCIKEKKSQICYIFCGRIDIGYTDELAIVEICFCCLWSDLSVGVS